MPSPEQPFQAPEAELSVEKFSNLNKFELKLYNACLSQIKGILD